MIIRYESGRRREAILLAANAERMRVAVGGQSDTAELIRVEDSWFTEKGEAVELEALLSSPGVDVSVLCSDGQFQPLGAKLSKALRVGSAALS